MKKRKSSFQTKLCAYVSLGSPFLPLSNNYFTSYSSLTRLMTLKLLNQKSLPNDSSLQTNRLMSIPSFQAVVNQVINQVSQSIQTTELRNQEHSSNDCKALNYFKKSKNQSRFNNQIFRHSHLCLVN